MPIDLRRRNGCGLTFSLLSSLWHASFQRAFGAAFGARYIKDFDAYDSLQEIARGIMTRMNNKNGIAGGIP
jgi:hypothetical protein